MGEELGATQTSKPRRGKGYRADTSAPLFSQTVPNAGSSSQFPPSSARRLLNTGQGRMRRRRRRPTSLSLSQQVSRKTLLRCRSEKTYKKCRKDEIHNFACAQASAKTDVLKKIPFLDGAVRSILAEMRFD